MLPKITIVTPSYNKAEYLEDTILSVLSQGYPNLEYIIIDGGSTDGSVDIIKKYADRLAYWVSEKDHGVYHAVAKGFGLASGEIMGWIGADDMLHPRSLFTIADIFTNCKDIDWVTGANTWYDEHGRTIRTRPAHYFSRLDLLSGNYKWIQQESTYWRRSLYDKVGGLDTTLRLAGDLDLWIKFTRHTRLYLTHALIGGFRQVRGGTQLSDDTSAYDREAAAVIQTELAAHPSDRKKVDSIFRRRRLRHLLHIPQRGYHSEAPAAEQHSQTVNFDSATRKFQKSR